MNNQYKKCPICELNYIQQNEKMCSICRKERKLLENDNNSATILCPYCGENYIEESKEMCDVCREEEGTKGDGFDDDDQDDNEYLEAVEGVSSMLKRTRTLLEENLGRIFPR